MRMKTAEIRRDEEEKAVSPVIATILMVAITVVLAGVLYVWANNLASEGTDTSIGTLNTYTTEDADDETGPGADDTLVRMQVTGKDDLAWAFIKITVSVGDNVYTCSVIAGDDCEISQAAGDNDNAWEPGEYLFLSEGTDDICSEAECLLLEDAETRVPRCHWEPKSYMYDCALLWPASARRAVSRDGQLRVQHLHPRRSRSASRPRHRPRRQGQV